MSDTETLTDEQAVELENQERAAEAVAEPAPEEPEADGAETPEEATEEAPSETQAGKEQGMVPFGALHQERERRKELQAKVDRMERLWEAAQEKQPEAPKEPSFEEAPLDHLKRRADEFAAFQRQQAEAANQQAATQRLVGEVEARELAFRQEHPDYDNAVQFAKLARVNELVVLGQDPARARAIVQQEALGIAADALSRGADPADTFYRFAQHRGYRQAQPQPVDAEKVRAQTRSLGGAAGKPPAGRVTLSQLAEMDPNDPAFEKAFNSMQEWMK